MRSRYRAPPGSLDGRPVGAFSSPEDPPIGR